MMRFKETLPRAAFGSVLALAVLLTGCGEAQVNPGAGLNREPQAQATYTAPPQGTGVIREGAGRVLIGRAAPSARVRPDRSAPGPPPPGSRRSPAAGRYRWPGPGVRG